MVLAAVVLAVRPSVLSLTNPVYTIDFIGPTGGGKAGGEIAAPAPAAPAAAREKASPAAKASKAPKAKPAEDDFSVKKHSGPLPRPSVLSGTPRRPVQETAAPPAVEPDAEADEGAGEGGGMGGVSTDFSNFPYPWYITEVRVGLWNQWVNRMPRGGALECVVGFEIARDGSVSSVKIGEASGNSLFDYAAQTATQAAAPFPPLPAGFKDSKLRVHVKFTAVR